jgi:hypothetical protein
LNHLRFKLDTLDGQETLGLLTGSAVRIAINDYAHFSSFLAAIK